MVLILFESLGKVVRHFHGLENNVCKMNSLPEVFESVRILTSPVKCKHRQVGDLLTDLQTKQVASFILSLLLCVT